jgi:hypothetical protein
MQRNSGLPELRVIQVSQVGYTRLAMNKAGHDGVYGSKGEATMKRTLIALATGAALIGTAAAHHGWGSYDAANPITVAGPIQTSKYENPHATITVKASDKDWTVTLAPTSRMTSRGATADLVAAGKTVSAYGYKSNVNRDEMRAERITIDGKTIEMR